MPLLHNTCQKMEDTDAATVMDKELDFGTPNFLVKAPTSAG